MAALLIVDDEPVLLHQLAVALRTGGHEVHSAGTASEALERAAEVQPDVILLDMRLPDRSGLSLIPELLALDGAALVVLMTAYGTVEDALEAIRRGAVDYLTKPLNVGEVGLLIDRLLEEQRRERELAFMRERGATSPAPIEPRGAVASILTEVRRLCDAGAAPGCRPPILIRGEPGTGKHALAWAIHARLGGGPFLPFHCGEGKSEQIAQELFGSSAANGRRAAQPGLFEAAQGGTLLLEEIDCLPRELHEPVRRAIAEQKTRRIGSKRDRDLDVHVIATSRRDLAALGARKFLPALLEQLTPLCFQLPPLRDRLEELGELAREMARRLGNEHDGQPRVLAPAAERELLGYGWPGNLRELRNVIERAVLLSTSHEISREAVAGLLGAYAPAEPGQIVLPDTGLRFEDVERDLLRQALARARGNRTRASALLGMTRDTLRYRIAKLGLEVPGRNAGSG